MRIALIGEGTIGGLFEDIPFRPPQGGYVTHIWEDLVSQRIFSRALWRSKAVSGDVLLRSWMVSIYHVYKRSVLVLWVHGQVHAET